MTGSFPPRIGLLCLAGVMLAFTPLLRSAQSSSASSPGRTIVSAPFTERPKIRAITAFIKMDPEHYQTQVREALVFLHSASDAFKKTGYDVQSIRITTQPFPEYAGYMTGGQAVAFFQDYDRLATAQGFDASIGPAMLADKDDPRQTQLLAKILESTTTLEGSIIIADTDGVHWRAISAASRLISDVAEHTPHSQGNFRFAATAMLKSGSPFYPGSYYSGVGNQFALALQSANVVDEVFRRSHDPAEAAHLLEQALEGHVRAIDGTARSLAASTTWAYGGIDLSPAPLKEVSIGGAIEHFTGGRFGGSGTLTAAATITQALRAVPFAHVGYSGLFLPILEDSVLAQRWAEGAISVDALLAYSSVCGTGLDTVPLPGGVTRDQLVRILSDVATEAYKLNKPLSARLLPVTGKKAGERTEFSDPFLVNTTLQPLP
jgi:uncharacterized protein (UPF0210 family)